MTVDAKILKRLEDLIVLGEEVRATRRKPAPGYSTADHIDVQLANRWLTSCLSFLSRVFGEDSAHYQRIRDQFSSYPEWSNVDQAFGVLLAAKVDYIYGVEDDGAELLMGKRKPSVGKRS
ncbi:MAG TPA: hypothetical protein PLS25_02375 [Methanoregulaceae archaeon]|nr:hypothetical protein [Methanoregulaceae archaeon]